jgi:hypothetical protein
MLLIDFLSSRPVIALLASVFGGAVITAAWAETSHLILRRNYPQFTGKDRSFWGASYIGIVERLLVTMLTIWVPQALGALAATLLVLKAVMGWGDLQNNQDIRPARARYGIALMNSVVSMIWAIGWGIWGTSK